MRVVPAVPTSSGHVGVWGPPGAACQAASAPQAWRRTSRASVCPSACAPVATETPCTRQAASDRKAATPGRNLQALCGVRALLCGVRALLCDVRNLLCGVRALLYDVRDRKSTRLNSSH